MWACKIIGNERGTALILAILFSLIINGVALTLYVTSSNELSSSSSQVIAQDSFNVAEAGLNIGMLRIKALMEANDPIDPSTPFTRPPFALASEGGVADDNLNMTDYRYFDLVRLVPLNASAVAEIQSNYIDGTTNTFTGPIDGFFTPETSNPDLMTLYAPYKSGAEPLYTSLIDTGSSALLRGWRVYLMNDNDRDDKTAKLVSVGYLFDISNNVLYQKKVEAIVYIHGLDVGRQPDPSGQLTSSARGARTGRFRVTSSLEAPVSSYDIR
ncbi:MAG TPA: PilX N-terminal domain-containing pilus assembly protein [Acidobacteriota bacterium]|nr:PilX N-terminal domain-containing pilus assembly protein [Acidobacteriota bacterium]